MSKKTTRKATNSQSASGVAQAEQREPKGKLSPEEEGLLADLTQRMEARMRAALLGMVRRLMEREPEEIFGPGEFELRDSMNVLTAQLMEDVVNARAKSKKGVLGS